MTFPLPVPKHVELVSPGIVRNLLKQTFYLRVPADQDRPARTYPIKSGEDLKLDAQYWYLVEDNLVQLDRDKVLKIIRYPNFNPPASGSFINFVDGPIPPYDQSLYWISSITGDYYVFDPSINMWRSLSTKVVPFFRSPSQGTPMAPFGSSFASYPMWVNPTQDRDYLAFRAFLYVDDGTTDPNHHNIVISSPGTADQVIQAVNKQTVEVALSTRIITPAQTLGLRHGTELLAKYIHASIELTHIVAP
jgi:hypothetical protein